MTDHRSVLKPALQDIEDIISDCELSNIHNIEDQLSRLLEALTLEPLSGFLESEVPAVDFQDWWASTRAELTDMAGCGKLSLPREKTDRVGILIELCRSIASGKTSFYRDFAIHFCSSGRHTQDRDYILRFSAIILRPLLRDITRLTENRLLQPFLLEAMGNLPSSGDTELDEMIKEANAQFRDPAPNACRDAVKTLWDCWERLKTLEAANKKQKQQSIEDIIENASEDEAFRNLLEEEARALTKVGNEFRIRHSETYIKSIDLPEHYDYLYCRMYALIHLLLRTRFKKLSK